MLVMKPHLAPKTLKSLKKYGVAVLVFCLVGGAVGLWIQTRGKSKSRQTHRFLDKESGRSASQDEAVRAAESRIRAELERKYLGEVAALKKSLDEAERQNAPSPLALPETGSVSDVRKLRSGIPFLSEIKIDKGGLASVERKDDQSYTAAYQLSLRLPEPVKTIVDLEQSCPELSRMLPGLHAMIETAEVSSWFTQLYQNKVARIRRDAALLNEVLTKHNLYDCETMLHLTSASGRKVFFLQAEMDVVSDGSDGDRLPTMPDEIVNSANYQPFTSYCIRDDFLSHYFTP